LDTAPPSARDYPATLVDLARYPILNLDAPAMQEVLRWAHAQLAATGACEVPNFLTPAGLAAVTADAQALAPRAYRSTGVGSAYLEVPDFELPADHPRRVLGEYAVGVIAYDMFPSQSPLRRLYEWNPMMDFIGSVLQRGRLHRYADPLGALNLAATRCTVSARFAAPPTDSSGCWRTIRSRARRAPSCCASRAMAARANSPSDLAARSDPSGSGP
jgi:hypothetical protein